LSYPDTNSEREPTRSGREPTITVALAPERRCDATHAARGSIFAAAILSLSILLGGEGDQLHAQLIEPASGETAPSFEVATVKQNVSGARTFRSWSDGDEYHLQNLTLLAVIKASYGLQSDAQVSGGPPRLLSEHFDITGKVDEHTALYLRSLSEASVDRQYALMLQSLLADRFQLAVQVTSKLLPVIALIPEKGGVKLTNPVLSTSQPPDGDDAGRRAGDITLQQPAVQRRERIAVKIFIHRAEIVAKDSTLNSLANALSGLSELGGLPVINQTGLDGGYDWDLQWTPDNANKPANSDVTPAKDWPALNLNGALSEQLGLRLSKQKGSVPAIVINRIEPPTPN
jgi:uncharacterized protein (TIGR03435 family)